MSIRVLMMTSWNVACGVAEMSKRLLDGLAIVDPAIEILPAADPSNGHLPLSPDATLARDDYDILHLQHHDALHAAWQPDHLREAQRQGKKVVVTFHDTFMGTPAQMNSAKCHALHDVADAFIVHEPVQDLPKAIHWRHGVPPIERPIMLWDYDRRRCPIVGSAGFDFPFKNFDLLCEAAAIAGWRVLLIGPNFTPERIAQWQRWQPQGYFPGVNLQDFGPLPSQAAVVACLSACDATAFLYNNANTGVSGAVRFGIAARKPCLLMDSCRQFNDVMFDPGLRECFYWTRYETQQIAEDLSRLPSVRFDHGLCRLAERDSYLNVGRKYAGLYRELVTYPSVTGV